MDPKWILVLVFSIPCLFATGQQMNSYPITPQNSYLKWGDSHYQNSFNGIKSLMIDVQLKDSNLHQNLEEQYETLLKRQQTANTILWSGIGAGTILVIAGTASVIKNAGSETKGASFGTIVGGSLIVITAGVFYATRSVNQKNILNFTNLFNNYSQRNKLEFSLQPDIRWSNGLSSGLSLQLVF